MLSKDEKYVMKKLTTNLLGFIISKLFSCLLEWLMVIDPMILSETELCQLVFDVIEYALHITSVWSSCQVKGAWANRVGYRKEDLKSYFLILLICDQRTGGKRKCHSSSSCSRKSGHQFIKSMPMSLRQRYLKVIKAMSR